MAANIVGVFEDELKTAINNSKVLVVGAGGIGCELLKNLVLSGFKDIEIIDLDTIDVSNLNRQFLFQKQHVGKSKASVARESALRFNPDASIIAYHDNVTSEDYGLNFFKKFAIVMNALDNRAARNHVNRLCLAANVPLIESGTAGYDGQVELIKKGLTQCYECEIKAPSKSYPGCTIRNTPSEPIHCIVWSKHLFNQLFGEGDPDEEVSPDTADPEAVGNAGEEALASAANEQGNVDRVSTRAWAQEIGYDAKKLFNKLFYDDIMYLRAMKHLWKSRRQPVPAEWSKLSDAVAGSSSKSDAETGLKDQRLWSISECAEIFAQSTENLKNKLSKLGDGDYLVWDKDDNDAMDFVASCSNIRSHVFGIAEKSRFDIKSMAGNIIPAIATTNAITAGIVVLHAFKALRQKYEECQTVYLRYRTNFRKQQVIPEKNLTKPKPKCYVCSAKPEVGVRVDVDLMTVKEFEEKVLKKALNMVAPDVILARNGTVVISSEEGETEINNPKKLAEIHVVDGSILKVDDFLQNYELTITVSHKKQEKDKPDYVIMADLDQLKPKPEEEAAKEDNNGASDKDTVVEDDDDLEMVEVDEPMEASEQVEVKKRKTESEEDICPSKKRKANGGGDDVEEVNSKASCNSPERIIEISS